jgi:putative phosphoesterase
MKFVIASDIHGSAFWCGKLVEVVEEVKPDKILLLGDILYHGPRNDLPKGYAPKQVIPMLDKYKDRILCVRGNCEAEVDQMVLPFPCMADCALVDAEGLTMYLTHGHHHSPDNLPPLAEGSVFLSGHTHVKLDEMRNGIRCINPGSVSIPKDGSNSCIVYHDGKFSFRILEE